MAKNDELLHQEARSLASPSRDRTRKRRPPD